MHLHHGASWLAARVRQAHRRRMSRQAGFALLVVTVTVAILGAVVGEFGYNTRVELEAASNARDQLRAEYLARSGINLSRLLVKVQQTVLDKNRNFIGDIQIADFAPYLIKAFGGPDDERAGLGALLGFDTSKIKGLGVSKDASFDVPEFSSEDGKININCGGGINPGFNANAINANTPPPGAPPGGGPLPGQPVSVATAPQALYAVLTALFFPPRYNRLFDNPDAEGQYATRDEIARAIIDWSDVDEQRFEPTGPSSSPEDYHYDTQKDPYKPHNHYYDTVEEMQMVRGVGDDFYGSFGDMLTVYGGCKVNLGAIKPESWPITAAIIRATAKNQQDPILLDDEKVAALAQQIQSMASLLGGFRTVDDFLNYASSGGMPSATAGSGSPLDKLLNPGGSSTTSSTPPQPAIPGLVGVQLDRGRLAQVATVGPRKIYRIESTGTVTRPGGKKIEVRIKAVWDTLHFNQNTISGDPNDRVGTWVYWRVE